MNYDGIEVDMLSLGNADSLLVTNWANGVPSRVLIDGGKKGDAEQVLAFLKARGVKYVDHVLCSHPHDDHAGGLPDIIASKDFAFGQAWMHLPWNHVDIPALSAAIARGETSAKRVVKIIRGSMQSSKAIVAAVQRRGKPLQEPFQGQAIGFMTVCGPSMTYYQELLKEFTDFQKLVAMEEALAEDDQQNLLEDVLGRTAFGNELLEKTAAEGELGAAPTQPENNSSSILGAVFGNRKLLLTADAGVPALERASEAYDLSGLEWMQIPHHGSRRNVSKELITYFSPKTACVSADGTRKHPRRAVVNAFKAVGTSVYSTHYPTATHLWFTFGIVPGRQEYSSLTPLYDAEESMEKKAAVGI
jgi:beta-lactamase superfamily II metal-dependent hydrolase